MKICSIREVPEYIPAILEDMSENWWECLTWTRGDIEKSLKASTIPNTFVAFENGEYIGMYTLLVKNLLFSEETGLWIGTLYITPKARDKHLSPILLEHAERMGGALGYDLIYLASDHVNYYEKFGFKESGPDLCIWGEPTKMYVHDTIHSVPTVLTA